MLQNKKTKTASKKINTSETSLQGVLKYFIIAPKFIFEKVSGFFLGIFNIMFAKRDGVNRVLSSVIAVLLFISVLNSGYSAYGYFNKVYGKYLLVKMSNAEALSIEEQGEIVKAVSKHILIPTETGVTISRIAKAQELALKQNFFVGSIDGDFLIAIARTRQAIVFSPSRDIVVNVGPFVVDK